MKAFSAIRILSIVAAAAVLFVFVSEYSNAGQMENFRKESAAPAPDVTAGGMVIDKNGDTVGKLEIQEGPKGVLLMLSLENIPEGRHGIHFHEKADCSNREDFSSAGAHYVPAGVEDQGAGYFDPEGGPHAGNLPNITAHEDGKVDVEIYTSLVSVKDGPATLFDEDGSALVVHQDPDSYLSHTAAGARIACAEIERFVKVQKDTPEEE